MKSASPATKTLRVPTRSPSRPAGSSSRAKATKKPLTTHASPVSVKPRSVRIVGSATFTIVPSRITISWVAEQGHQGSEATSVRMGRVHR